MTSCHQHHHSQQETLTSCHQHHHSHRLHVISRSASCVCVCVHVCVRMCACVEWDGWVWELTSVAWPSGPAHGLPPWWGPALPLCPAPASGWPSALQRKTQPHHLAIHTAIKNTTASIGYLHCKEKYNRIIWLSTLQGKTQPHHLAICTARENTTASFGYPHCKGKHNHIIWPSELEVKTHLHQFGYLLWK